MSHSWLARPSRLRLPWAPSVLWSRAVRRAAPRGPWYLWALWGVALVGLTVLALFTAWFCIRSLSYPYQLLYGEGFMLEFARRLAAGESLYKPLAEFPLGTVNYPPLPLLLARLAFPIAGFGYAAGRIWAILAALAVAVILYSWVRRSTGQLLPAVVSALAWLGAPYVYHWAPQFRADLLGLAFSMLGVYIVWRWWPGRALYAAAPLFVLSLYCKQSFLAAPAAAVLALLLARRARHALLLGGLTLLLGGVPFLMLSATTGGAFFESLVSANVDPFHLDRLAHQTWSFLLTYLPLLVLTVFGLLDRGPEGRWGSRSRPDSDRERLVVAYMGLGLLSGALAGKAGSWENYFLEPLAMICLGAGLGLARLRSRPAGRWLAPVLVGIQVALMWHTPTQAAELMRADAAANRALGPRVAAVPGLVLAEDAGLLVQAGKPVPYYDFQLSQLALAGRWDQSWEIENLQRGAFPLVILEDDSRINVERYGRYTRRFMSALDYGYRPVARVGKYRIYRPAPLTRERAAQFRGGPALVGHTSPPVEAQPGETLSLDMVWQATQPMTQTYTSFLHLLDASGQGRAGDDHQPWNGLYPTSRWAEGEMVRMSYTLTLPLDLSPGLYTLNAGWYDVSNTRLETGAGSDLVPVAVVGVPDPAQVPAPAGVRVGAQFENGVVLAAYDLVQEPEAIRVSLDWETAHSLDADYAVFVHVRDSRGEIVAQSDGPPLAGAWPTSLWPTGHRLSDARTIALPSDLPPGEYEVVAGLYDPVTGQRLRLTGGGDAVPLREIATP